MEGMTKEELRTKVFELFDELIAYMPMPFPDVVDALVTKIKSILTPSPDVQERTKEEIELVDIPEPIGNYLLKNFRQYIGRDGAYFHYADMCVALKQYSDQQTASLKNEVERLKDIITDYQSLTKGLYENIDFLKQRIKELTPDGNSKRMSGIDESRG